MDDNLYLKAPQFSIDFAMAQDNMSPNHTPPKPPTPKLPDPLPPTMFLHQQTQSLIELAVHRPGRALLREIAIFLKPLVAQNIIPDISSILVITTCQHSKVELAAWGEAQNTEKQRLLESFQAIANDICDALCSLGYWADFADPTSGLLNTSPGQVPWPEVQALERLRKYHVSQTGRCHVVVHPKWGYHMYPASLFTNAPWEQVNNVLNSKMERRRVV